MKTLEQFKGAIVAFVMLAAFAALATNEYSDKEALNRTRACIPKDGHSTQLTVSSSDASGDLGQNKVYMFVCTGATSIYWEMGDSAAATADSNSNFLPVDTVMYFATGSGDQSRYISAVDSATSAGTCYVTECE